MTAMRHPVLGMCPPKEYKCSCKIGMSWLAGSTYMERESVSLTTPALIFDLKYFTYSSIGTISAGEPAISESTVLVLIFLATSSNGTRCVMSKTFWLLAADLRATSTSWIFPCKIAARVGIFLDLLRETVIVPVQAGTVAPSRSGAFSGREGIPMGIVAPIIDGIEGRPPPRPPPRPPMPPMPELSDNVCRMALETAGSWSISSCRAFGALMNSKAICLLSMGRGCSTTICAVAGAKNTCLAGPEAGGSVGRLRASPAGAENGSIPGGGGKVVPKGSPEGGGTGTGPRPSGPPQPPLPAPLLCHAFPP
mmetsp:Transcript_57581/g.122461  ORF Transcript_57581/g.122461 Transcript_57581/m.122461 type:complete len:308 (+) Transcript_57581:317-1240(+)